MYGRSSLETMGLSGASQGTPSETAAPWRVRGNGELATYFVEKGKPFLVVVD
jgi:hypothetical protein